MPKLAPEYELVLMLDPEVDDARREEIAVDARRRIESGGTLKQERSWGTRKMAYEIAQRNEADYRFFRFEKGDAVLDELNHSLRITDGVLRFRIFKVDPRAPVVDPPPPFSLESTGERPGGRGRRDDRGGGGGRYEDRPPRGPDPEPEAARGEAASEPVSDSAPEPAAPVAEESAPAEQAPVEDSAAAAEPAEPAAAEPAPAEDAPEAAAPADDAGSAPADADPSQS